MIRDIRNFIFGLRPLLLDSGSLLDGLRALADELRRNTTTEIEVTGDESDGVAVEVVAEQLAIGREALANVARHSGAGHAVLRLDSPGEDARLEIADDGRGLAPDADFTRGHHGLANMRARAEALGGSFDIQSGHGTGTRIVVVIPRKGTRRGASQ